MSRTARFNRPHTIVHIISRFVNQEWFIPSAEERTFYLFLLGRALRYTDWECLAYAIMSNHVHLQFLVGQMAMESWTRRVHSPFAHWINERRDRIGPVFAGRAKDLEFLSGSSGNVTAYIHNNPVRAGVVARARDSDWTSQRAYAGLVEPPPWLHVGKGLDLAGFRTGAAFDEWVDITPGERSDAAVEDQRRVVRRRGAVEIGTPLVTTEGTEFPLVKRPYGHVRPDPQRVIDVVIDVIGVSRPILCSSTKKPLVVEARAVAVRSAAALGLTASEIAAALGISVEGVRGLARRGASVDSKAVLDVIVRRLRAETWGESAGS